MTLVDVIGSHDVISHHVIGNVRPKRLIIIIIIIIIHSHVVRHPLIDAVLSTAQQKHSK